MNGIINDETIIMPVDMEPPECLPEGESAVQDSPMDDSVLNTPVQNTHVQSATTPMGMSLAQRRSLTIRQCTAAARSADRCLLFGLSTSLKLHAVPLPRSCDDDTLHTVSSSRAKRVRIHPQTLTNHTWAPLANARNTRINRHVYALDLFHTWAQLSMQLPLESLIALGEAIITAISRQPSLASNRTPEDIHRDFAASFQAMPRFKGRRRCAQAMTLIRPHVDSLQESELNLALLTHGLPGNIPNYTVPDVTFKSGASMTLDMAWPEYRVAVEYDGDHHRTDKAQWHKDQEKRERLRGLDWVIGVATSGTLKDAAATADFIFPLARQLALRGADVPFRLIAMPVEQLVHDG